MMQTDMEKKRSIMYQTRWRVKVSILKERTTQITAIRTEIRIEAEDIREKSELSRNRSNIKSSRMLKRRKIKLKSLKRLISGHNITITELQQRLVRSMLR